MWKTFYSIIKLIIYVTPRMTFFILWSEEKYMDRVRVFFIFTWGKMNALSVVHGGAGK